LDRFPGQAKDQRPGKSRGRAAQFESEDRRIAAAQDAIGTGSIGHIRLIADPREIIQQPRFDLGIVD
jgi:hypothetical protein